MVDGKIYTNYEILDCNSLFLYEYFGLNPNCYITYDKSKGSKIKLSIKYSEYSLFLSEV